MVPWTAARSAPRRSEASPSGRVQGQASLQSPRSRRCRVASIIIALLGVSWCCRKRLSSANQPRAFSGVAKLLPSFPSARWSVQLERRTCRGAQLGEVSSRTWKQAHQAAKQVDSQLRQVISEAGLRVRELDGLFLKREPSAEAKSKPNLQPQQAVNKSRPDADNDFFNIGKLMSVPAQKAIPDGEEYSPVLAGELAAGGKIIGLYSSSASLALPVQMPKLQMIYGTVEDPAMTAEENELWRQSLLLLVDTLEPLWPEAEARFAAVVAAEQQAGRRRSLEVDSLRTTVLRQMSYADETESQESLEAMLNTLQTDKRLLKYLGLLERSALEGEELQAQMERLKEKGAKATNGGRQQYQITEDFGDVYQKTRTLDAQIRACCRAAQELPDTLDAYKELGDMWAKINPFR
ncbi:unnamed protein product [Polarella glacialis]|uniref:Uncharacterized protein n=2 Tax=Polarella glacialis TaxID=89957 RepID=A0A813GJT7_POLGL|nr:unnamed protein product [Polarella glacialis]